MRRPEAGFWIVCAIAAAFAAVLAWLGIWRYEIFRAGVDAGIFTQVVLSLGGCFCAAAEGNANHLLVHWSPVLVLAYPFVRIAGDARGLIVLQALAVSLTAFPLYGIGRMHVDSMRAAMVTGVAMLFPALWAQTFTDFHENAFVPVLSAALGYGVLRKNWRVVWFAVGALLLVKEDQFVAVAAIGLILALTAKGDRDLRKFGLGAVGAAVVVALVYFEIVRRTLLGASVPYWSLHFYDWRSSIPTPLGYVAWNSPERLSYLFWAFLPLLFLPFGSRLLLLAIPGFVEVLASRERITMILGTHYSMLWSGYVLAAFADASGRLMQRRRPLGALVAAGALVASMCVLKYNDPMSRWYYLYRSPDANDALLERTLASIPHDSSLGASDEIYAHLGSRPLAHPGVSGDYYVADTALGDPTWENRDKAALDAALRAKTYRIISRRDGIIVAARMK